jgi:hypothetical protein
MTAADRVMGLLPGGLPGMLGLGLRMIVGSKKLNGDSQPA